MDNSLGYGGSPVVRLRPHCCSRNECKLISGSPAELLYLYHATSLVRVGPTAAAAEAVVATPVKPVIYLMKNQFHRENLQISGVPD